MNKQLLIIKNKTNEGPGLLETELKERGIEYSINDLDKGEDMPPVDDILLLASGKFCPGQVVRIGAN